MRIDIPTLNHLDQAAATFVPHLKPGSIVALHGEMGAGKTTFTKAVCRQLGVEDRVNSPTFSIVNEHLLPDGKRFYHFDFYRIDDLREALDMGCQEYFDSGNICFLEWPEKIAELLPANTLHLHIRIDEEGGRSIEFQP